jgi:hypothetical protein
MSIRLFGLAKTGNENLFRGLGGRENNGRLRQNDGIRVNVTFNRQKDIDADKTRRDAPS